MKLSLSPQTETVSCFAPSNIALVKYWGKRNLNLNLPNTGSLSISLGNKGSTTNLRVSAKPVDSIRLNGRNLPLHESFSQRLVKFFNAFQTPRHIFFEVDTHNNIPTAAGLASSASGFAALVMAMNELCGWQLSLEQQSRLARLGSGSACRSFWHGFVEWHRGIMEDGSDSFATPIATPWENLQIGLLIVSHNPKTLGSTEAMIRTTHTSVRYQTWPEKVSQALVDIKKAIATRDFHRLGEISESNALAMHDTMLDSIPPIQYCTSETIKQREKVWALRRQGIPVYFTQDAGPNLKLLFQTEYDRIIRETFPEIESVELAPPNSGTTH